MGRTTGIFCLALMMSLGFFSEARVGVALAQGLVESVNLKQIKTGKQVRPSGKVKKAKKAKLKKVKKAKAKKTKLKTANSKRKVRKNSIAAKRARVLRKNRAQNRLKAQRSARNKARQRQIVRRNKRAQNRQRAKTRQRAQTRQKARTRQTSTSVASGARSQKVFKARLNQNTVTLMSGCCTTGAYTAFGADIKDMVSRLGNKNGLRVLPVLGGGAGTNIRDILYLRGVDMAIINTDVIDYFKDQPLYENLTDRIRYITMLFNEEVHFYAGSEVSSLADLQGKVVGFNNSNAEVTGLILFEKLGIKPRKTLRISEADGALALKEGRIDAMLRVTGKPIRSVSRLKVIFPQIRLLPINYDPAFIGSHLPTRLTHDDYPELIAKGQVVPTIATRTILAVFNWRRGSERYRRLEKFAKLFFENYARLRSSKNLHPKWAEVNLQATVPGLKRFAPVQKWLDDQSASAHRQPVKPVALADRKTDKSELMTNFKNFMAARKAQGGGAIKKSDSEKLIADFLRWEKAQR